MSSFLALRSTFLPSRVQNSLQWDNTSSLIDEQRGLTQNLQVVMNMDYRLEPITDKCATSLVRDAFTRFSASESSALIKKDYVRTHDII